MERAVEIVLAAAGVYALLGILAAIALHARGLGRIDPATRGAHWTFALLVTPGIVALWPILLRRWLRAAPPPDPARPVPPRGLRRTQAIVVRVVAVVVAVAGTLAIVSRPAVPGTGRPGSADVAGALDPTALPAVSRPLGAPFGDLPIEVRLRSGPAGVRQLELDVARDLLIPTLALYWVPGALDPAADGPGEGAVFLGTVWGPGTRRVALPGSADGAGMLVLHSIARAETVARAPVSLGEAPR